MNNTKIQNKIISFSLLLGIFYNSLHAMHFNDMPINSLLNQDQTLSFIPHKKENNLIKLEIQNNNVTIGVGDINYITNLKESFEFLKSQKNNFAQIKVKKTSVLNAKKEIHNNAAYLKGGELFKLQAGLTIYSKNCLLNSPKLDFSANKIEFINSFLIKPRALYLCTTCPKSNCIFFHIKFDQKATNPTLITGHIDFENNQTPEPLILSNVQEIEIMFAPKAWGIKNISQ